MTPIQALRQELVAHAQGTVLEIGVGSGVNFPYYDPLRVHKLRVFSGLFLTRDIPSLLAAAGFQIERVDRAYLSPFPKSWSHCCWGIAARA